MGGDSTLGPLDNGERNAIDRGNFDAVFDDNIGVGSNRALVGVVAVRGLRAFALAAGTEVGQVLRDGAGRAVVAVAPAAVLLVAALVGGIRVDAAAERKALAGLSAGEEGNGRKKDGGKLHFDDGGW